MIIMASLEINGQREVCASKEKFVQITLFPNSRKNLHSTLHNISTCIAKQITLLPIHIKTYIQLISTYTAKQILFNWHSICNRWEIMICSNSIFPIHIRLIFREVWYSQFPIQMKLIFKPCNPQTLHDDIKRKRYIAYSIKHLIRNKQITVLT